MPSDVDISIGADTSGAAAGFAQLTNYVTKARTDIERQFSSAISFAGITGGLIGIASAISNIVEYGAKIYDLGQRFAISTDTIQRFGGAAERSGSSLEGVTMGFNKLDIATSKALGGNKSIIESFANLGVSVEDLQSLSPEEIMVKIGGSSMNAADMVKILGRSGTELRETLRKLADGTEQFSKTIDPGHIKTLKEADDWYIKLRQDAVVWGADMAAGFKDAQDGLNNFLKSFFTWQGLKENLFSKSAWTPGGGIFQQQSEKPLGPTIEEMTGRPAIGGRPAVSPEGGSPIVGAEDVGEALRQAGGGPDAELRKEETLRERIAKIEEETAARERSDQDQLLTLQKQRAQLTTDMLTAQGHIGGEAANEKTQLEATLAVAEKSNEIGKLSAKIEQDKLDAADKITKEREKEAAQAEQNLVDAREANKEMALEAIGRKDLADRAKIEYDYDKQIQQAKADKAAAEEQGFTQVANTNAALITQLSLEKQNALAAHDKAEAEKQAAEVAAVAGRTTEVAARNAELEASLGGHKDLYDFLKKEGDLQLEIDQAVKDANEAWSEGNTALAQQDTLLAKALTTQQGLLATARQVAQTRAANDVAQQNIALGLDQSGQSATAKSLDYQYEMNKKIVAAQADGNYQLAQQLTLQRDLNQQMSLIPAVQKQGFGITPGTDATARAVSAGVTGVGYSDVAKLMATNVTTGAVDQTQLERNRALEQFYFLQGKGLPWSSVAVIGRQEALANLYNKQQLQQDETMREQTINLESYYSSIASGISPQLALSALTSRVGRAQALADIGAGTGVDVGPSVGTPTAGPGSRPGVETLAQATQLQHETAIQRLGASIPSLLGASVPNLASVTGATATDKTVASLQQTVFLLQQSLARLTSIDGRLSPLPGSH